MAGSLNKVILIGRLGRDPEMRYTPSGQPVANFSVATDESYTSKDGQKVEKTEWHRIVVWGKQAEFCGNYLSKGRLVYVEGKLETRKWTDKDGAEKYTTEIKADRVLGLDSRQSEGGYAPAPQYQQRGQAPAQGGNNMGYEEDLGPAFPSEASGMDDAPF
ncbi:Single-stranded DNA-binding protein [anaerobic digester metagenome]